jgi:sporulation protein YlmC with PRC-barrel domain
MTELKTLKDLERKIPTGDEVGGMKEFTIMIHSNELKSEAIKWVKSPLMFPEKKAKEWIINFFNLTEEDLMTNECWMSCFDKKSFEDLK